jgi:hypothetical protein
MVPLAKQGMPRTEIAREKTRIIENNFFIVKPPV